MKYNWIRRRWLNYRHGHGLYLYFALSFANFILIFQRLLIEQVPELNELFPKLWMFALVFILVYFPVAVLVGWFHNRTQMSIEQETYFRQNPFQARIFRMLLDSIDGKLSKDETENFRALLKSIEEGKGSTRLKRKKSKSETDD